MSIRQCGGKHGFTRKTGVQDSDGANSILWDALQVILVGCNLTPSSKGLREKERERKRELDGERERERGREEKQTALLCEKYVFLIYVIVG